MANIISYDYWLSYVKFGAICRGSQGKYLGHLRFKDKLPKEMNLKK
jgi:hypothetical protein